jgi:hypothetical protein
MKRVIKEAISGVLLIASFSSLFLFAQLESSTSNNSYGVFVLVSAILIFLSALALITFSKTGWRIAGSEAEWAAAGIMEPSILIFGHRDTKEQEHIEEKEDLQKEEGYYRNRSR